jgi:hypothetical protein
MPSRGQGPLFLHPLPISDWFQGLYFLYMLKCHHLRLLLTTLWLLSLYFSDKTEIKFFCKLPNLIELQSKNPVKQKMCRMNSLSYKAFFPQRKFKVNFFSQGQ